MKALTDEIINRVERSELIRALASHERKAAELRSQLGLVTREAYKSVDVATDPVEKIKRMRTDQIDRLYEAGKINIDHRAAALKIRTVWEAMARGLFPGAASGNMVGTKSRGTFRHPLERMSNREFFIWVMEYKPWATGPAAKTAIHHAPSHFKISYLQVCYNVIVDGYGPSQLERQWPVTKGKGVIVSLLRRGLGFWKHIEYDGSNDLEELRREISEAMLKRVDGLQPKR